MELAFTLAKNATKPNPFEIISQQTTRKENNWKTEETLARAVVTLRRNGSKGPFLNVYDDELPFILSDAKNSSGGDTYVNIYVLMIWSPLNVCAFKKLYEFCTVTSSIRAAERGFWRQMVLHSSGLF
jgi:hypothetical protein